MNVLLVFIERMQFFFSKENQLGFYMRYHLFLQYGWFLQNLGKDVIRTNMHTTVHTLWYKLDLTRIWIVDQKSKILRNFSSFFNLSFNKNWRIPRKELTLLRFQRLPYCLDQLFCTNIFSYFKRKRHHENTFFDF